jgi:glycosyltransferase involved in cell wall biosynthesis
MRIAFDSWTLASRFRHYGTYVYARNLIAEFKKIASNDPDLEFCLFTSKDNANDANAIEPGAGFELSRSSLLSRARLWRLGGAAFAAARAKADLIFSPTCNVLPIGSVPVVCTIHDAIPIRMPMDSKKVSMLLRFMTACSAKLSCAVITDSEWSKKDLIEIYGLPESKISVVYLGYEARVFHESASAEHDSRPLLERLGIKKPYIVHHGTIQPRKNLARLIAAYRLLLSRNKNLDHDLVLAGGLGWDYDEILRAASSHEPGRVILSGALSDQDLATLVRSASLAVIPSLYEGFCLPMVESMACGTPTIAARASCLPEVSGGVLRYFDPYSVEDMAACMEEALENHDLRIELSRNGKERAANFRWDQCARETLSVFRRHVRNGRN